MPLDHNRGHGRHRDRDREGAGDDSDPDAAARPTPPVRAHRDHDEYAELEPLLAAYAAAAPGSEERSELRERLVAGYLPVARNIARRYANRGEPLDDLIQTACIGLISAIDRYRRERGEHFLAFAVPTITGEVRRHFRDRTWAMRVPRRLKELHIEINSAVVELSQRLGRAPRPSEIAYHLDVTLDAVLEALAASHAYEATSLDRTLSPGEGSESDGSSTVGQLIGSPDAGFDQVTDSRAVSPYLAALPERERAILLMRFYRDMSQQQIADRIGISQMHVSRLLSTTLARLRDAVISDHPPG